MNDRIDADADYSADQYFMMCGISACSAKGDLDHDELLFFLTGGVGIQTTMPNPTDKSWLSDRSWDEICRMSALPSFKGFAYVSSELLLLGRPYGVTGGLIKCS